MSSHFLLCVVCAYCCTDIISVERLLVQAPGESLPHHYTWPRPTGTNVHIFVHTFLSLSTAFQRQRKINKVIMHGRAHTCTCLCACFCVGVPFFLCWCHFCVASHLMRRKFADRQRTPRSLDFGCLFSPTRQVYSKKNSSSVCLRCWYQQPRIPSPASCSCRSSSHRENQ